MSLFLATQNARQTDLVESASSEVPLSHCLLYALHLVLVLLAVAHSVLLRLAESLFQALHAFHACSQTLLQTGQLAAKVGVVTNQLNIHDALGFPYSCSYLLVDLCELLEIVLEELNLLLLSRARHKLLLSFRSAWRLLDPLGQILHEDLSKVMQGLELLLHGLFQT